MREGRGCIFSQGLKNQGKLSQTLFASTLRLGKKKYNGEKLSFIEIKEGEATYYLAPFEYYNEDFLTFKIDF